MTEAIPVVDVMGGNSGRNNGDFMGGGGGWIFAFLIIAIIFGAGNWGNNGNRGNSGGSDGGVATVLPYVMSSLGSGGGHSRCYSSEIADGFAMNNLQNGISGIKQGICDSTYAISNAINGLSGQLSGCCCENQRAIDGLRYTIAKEDCDTRNLIQSTTRDIIDANNANYRGLMDFMVQSKIDDLKERLAEKDSLISSLNLSASQANQNAAIGARIDAAVAEILRRTGNDCPSAAYIVQPPTPVNFPTNNCGTFTGFGNGGGNGCGC